MHCYELSVVTGSSEDVPTQWTAAPCAGVEPLVLEG